MVIAVPRKKIEILVDAPLMRRIRDLVADMGITAYTLQPILGGEDDQGRWLDDQVTGGAGSKIIFVTIVSAEDAKRLLSMLEPLLDEFGLVVTCSNVEIIRAG